ncbi:MAG: hypothetical protein RIR70_1900 [Pseudomonadota bacterium]|jgi:hemolysin activation/secretion protein
MKSAHFTCRFLMVSACLTSPFAFAQSIPKNVQQQIDEVSRQRVPVAPLPKTPSFDLRLQAPEKTAVPKAVDELRFEVEAVRVEGSTVYDKATLDGIFAAAVGPAVSLDALRTAADALESRYRSEGYFLTRVFIPPQEVRDGIFRVQVIEGYLAAVYVDNVADERLRQRIEAITAPLLKKRPIDVASIERALLFINDLPGVIGTSVLRQGAELGASEIVVSVAEDGDSHSLSFGNTGSKTIGPASLGLNSNFNRPLGLSGALNVGVNSASPDDRELSSLSVRYTWPVGAAGTSLSLGANVASAYPGGAVKVLGLESLSSATSLRLRQPLLRSRSVSLFADLGVSFNRSRTLQTDELVTHDRSTVAEARLSWQQNGWGNGSTTGALALSKGLPRWHAIRRDTPEADTASVVGFRPDFSKWSFSLTRIQPLPKGFSIMASLDAQHTRDRLLSGESIGFGGTSIGRGYLGSAITGERGMGGIIEFRYDTPVPAIGRVQFYASLDRASTRTAAYEPTGSEATHQRLASRAFGARVPIANRGQVDLQVGRPNWALPDDDASGHTRYVFMGSASF